MKYLLGFTLSLIGGIIARTSEKQDTNTKKGLIIGISSLFIGAGSIIMYKDMTAPIDLGIDIEEEEEAVSSARTTMMKNNLNQSL